MFTFFFTDKDGGAAGKSQLDDAEKSRLEQMVASRTEEEFENLLKSRTHLHI